MWARLGLARFLYGRIIGCNAPVPPPADAPAVGRWIDVNLTRELIVAYEARTPVRTLVTTTNMSGWEAPSAFDQILWRSANETMITRIIGAENLYDAEDVRVTQSFAGRAHALHFAWWRMKETIGRPESHGHINLLLEDARFFWDWATLGTLLYLHP